jgi:hypothetical protein
VLVLFAARSVFVAGICRKLDAAVRISTPAANQILRSRSNNGIRTMSETDLGGMVICFILSVACMIGGTTAVFVFGWEIAALVFVWAGYFILIAVGLARGAR